MKTLILRPPKLRAVWIDESMIGILHLLGIEKGSTCAAAVLARMEYWMKIKLDALPLAEQTNALQKLAGLEPTQDMELWVYKSAEQMHEEMLGVFGLSAIKQAFATLVETNLLLRRNNPHYRFDQTYQYMVNVPVVQELVYTWAAQTEHSFDSIQLIQRLNLTNGQVEFNRAIPNTTSNTTTNNLGDDLPDGGTGGAWYWVKRHGNWLPYPLKVQDPALHHLMDNPPRGKHSVAPTDDDTYQWLTPITAFATLFYGLRPDMTKREVDAIWEVVNKKAKRQGWWADAIQSLDPFPTVPRLIAFKKWLVEEKGIKDLRSPSTFAIRYTEWHRETPKLADPACPHCEGRGRVVVKKADPIMGGMDEYGDCSCLTK